MAAKTFGLFPSYAGRGERQVSMSSFMSDLDQERAITLGMESERLFLIGPPGTGKTSTEAALALEFLHSHKTVLLVAHTNVALDTAIKRLQQYCEQSGNTHHLKQHHILRIGASKELVGERYHDVTLQGIVDQKLGNLAQERDQLQQEQSNLQNALTHLARGLASQQQQWRNQRLDLEAQLTTAQQTYTLLQTCEQRRHSARVTRLEAIQKERQVQQKKQKEAGQVIQASKAALLASKARRAACEQELQIKRQELVKNP
jgi:hypothetical protein